jgi:1-deoxyxylulose-5-phosphate synthase
VGRYHLGQPEVRAPVVGSENIRPEGLSRAHLFRACDDSLRRLQTDYIDLYQTQLI